MNCWNVLGIEPTTDIKLIQGAYAELVKQHHPEDDPEGFMKLRKAYDQAKWYAKWKSASHIQQHTEVMEKTETTEQISESDGIHPNFANIPLAEDDQQHASEDETYQFEKADALADPSAYDNPLKNPYEFKNFQAPKPRSWTTYIPALCIVISILIAMGFVSYMTSPYQKGNSYSNYPKASWQPTGRYAFSNIDCYKMIKLNIQFYESISNMATTAIQNDKTARNKVQRDINIGEVYGTNEENLGMSSERYYELVEYFKSIPVKSTHASSELDAYSPNGKACAQDIKHRIVYLLETQTEYLKAPECLLLGITREAYNGFLSASKRLLTENNKVPIWGSFNDTPYPGADQDIMDMLKAYSSLDASGVSDFYFVVNTAKVYNPSPK